MLNDISNRIEEIAVELTEQLSVVDTHGELNSSQKVYDIFSNMDYYKRNPENLRFVNAVDDKLGRKSVLSVLKGGKGNSKKAVVLIGHTDTVGISDYEDLKEYANKPYELTEKFKERIDSLPKEVRDDIETGNYLFGRGLFDMKTGVAVIIAVMEEISKNIDEFEGNLVFGAVCDEESNSKGMLSIIPELIKLQDQEGFEYLGLIDTDYMTSEYEGDENKYIYVGTVGKLMPSFYIVGKETHVGEAFKGLDPNQLASVITDKLNMNVDFCDIAEGEVSLPPITLKQRDLKKEYSVQTAQKTTLFFNYATHTSTPDEIIIKMKDVAQEAFDFTIDKLNTQYKKFCNLSNRKYERLPWKSSVLTYDELYKEVKNEVGEGFDVKIENFIETIKNDESVDPREYSFKLIDEVYSMRSNRDPVIVVYFSPPYYPHIYIKGEVPKERKLLEAVAEAINTTKTDYKIVYKKFFPYISDLSYGSAPKDPKIIASLKNNMPGFGTKYNLPLEDMQRLDLPVINIGTFGKDAHKFTERLEKKYSFEVTPFLVYKTIINLLK